MYVTSHYRWSSLRSGLTVSCCGTAGVVFLLLFSVLLHFFSDLDLVLYGMAIMVLSCLLLTTPLTSTSSSAVPLWQFYSSIVLMYSVGYPIGHTALLGVFSKIMKSGPQGQLLGYFGSAGSLARVFFPVLAGVLAEYCGDTVIFIVMATLLIVSCAVFVACKDFVRAVISRP